MAVDSSAEATWNGDLAGGSGSVRPASGAFPEQRHTYSIPEEELAQFQSALQEARR